MDRQNEKMTPPVPKQISLSNEIGMKVTLTSLGCRVMNLTYVDKMHNIASVVAGLSSPDLYWMDADYLGCIVGRFANRIEDGLIRIDGIDYQLDCNEGPHQLHGGKAGFHTRIWEERMIHSETYTGVAFRLLSCHGDCGYPGDLSVTARFTIPLQQNELHIEYLARTDRPTVINLSNHAYFNLTGDFSKEILNHRLMLNCNGFLPVRSDLIPTGEKRPVDNSPMDFRRQIAINRLMDPTHDQIEIARGYDHCFIIDGDEGNLRTAAHVTEPLSGRSLKVLTTEPGLQFYTGNHLDGSIELSDGVTLNKHCAFCIETQRFPNAPNEPEFGQCLLRADEVYRSSTVYRFE